jgi:hypothetical protein
LEHMGPTHQLRAVAVPSRPLGAEFWLFFWADATARRPTHVTIRLFAFDGRSLRGLWAPANMRKDPDESILIEVVVRHGFHFNMAIGSVKVVEDDR